MMKNMARVLVAEGYNGDRTHAPGLVPLTFLTCCYASRTVTARLLDYPPY